MRVVQAKKEITGEDANRREQGCREMGATVPGAKWGRKEWVLSDVCRRGGRTLQGVAVTSGAGAGEGIVQDPAVAGAGCASRSKRHSCDEIFAGHLEGYKLIGVIAERLPEYGHD